MVKGARCATDTGWSGTVRDKPVAFLAQIEFWLGRGSFGASFTLPGTPPMFKYVAPLAAIGLFTAPASAQEAPPPSPLVSALAACRTIADEGARLACYDKASEALTGAAARGDIAVVDRDQVRKVRRSLFGFAVPKFPFFNRKDDKDDEPKEITSTVQGFAFVGNGRFRVVIGDSYGTWETTESAPLRDPKGGEKVTIKSGVMGSYFMQIGKQRWVRARRVR